MLYKNLDAGSGAEISNQQTVALYSKHYIYLKTLYLFGISP